MRVEKAEAADLAIDGSGTVSTLGRSADENVAHDSGDEHRDPPPVRLCDSSQMLAPVTIDQVLAEFGITEVAPDVFSFMLYAEGMRDCCQACALEANGEDGS